MPTTPVILIDVTDLRAALDVDSSTPDAKLEPIVAAANRLVSQFLVPDDATDPHATHSWDCEAAIAVASELLANRVSPGGQPVEVDGVSGPPVNLGKALLGRIEFLITPCRSVRNLV